MDDIVFFVATAVHQSMGQLRQEHCVRTVFG